MKATLMATAALAMILAGCADSNERSDDKREMDRVSYRNSSLQRQLDDQAQQLAKLHADLSAANQRIKELDASQNKSAQPASTQSTP